MAIKKLKDLIYENYNRQIASLKENSSFSTKHQKKDLLLLANKLIEKIPDVTNAKQYYPSCL